MSREVQRCCKQPANIMTLRCIERSGACSSTGGAFFIIACCLTLMPDQGLLPLLWLEAFFDILREPVSERAAAGVVPRCCSARACPSCSSTPCQKPCQCSSCLPHIASTECTGTSLSISTSCFILPRLATVLVLQVASVALFRISHVSPALLLLQVLCKAAMRHLPVQKGRDQVR